MILIKNKQRKISIDIKKIEIAATRMLAAINYQEFDLGILFCSDSLMQKYNRDFRQKDKPTDILSFPYHQNLKAGKRIKVVTEEDKNLGDIIIAPSYVQKNVKTLWNQTLEQRLPILIAHGIAHLIGYDHGTEDEYKKMLTVEKKLLKIIKTL
jgi:rRNA maturation RNase YbeY